MGSFFSKRCRECNSKKGVKLFKRLCIVCEAAAKRLEPPLSDGDKPLFGEYLCTKCTLGWTSRLCWPCHYQACRTCQATVYPHYWRDLTPADLSGIARDHRREYCQKCLEVGFYCGDYAKLYGKLVI